jgi:hypothetical protein
MNTDMQHILQQKKKKKEYDVETDALSDYRGSITSGWHTLCSSFSEGGRYSGRSTLPITS